jgi:hypothetical protein
MELRHRAPETASPQTSSGDPILSQSPLVLPFEEVRQQSVTLPRTNTIFGPDKTRAWTVGMFVFCAVASVMYLRGYSTMKDDVLAIRDMGIPMQIGDIARTVPLKGANAASDYMKFNSLWAGTRNEQNGALLSINQNAKLFPQVNRQEAMDELKPIVAPLILGSAQARWTFVYPPEHTPTSVSDTYGDLGTVHAGMQLLYALANGESKNGHPLAALPYLRSCTNICRQLGDNPGNEKKAIAWESEVLDQYCYVASAHASDQPLQRAISQDMSRLARLPNLKNVYYQEYWNDLSALDNVMNGPNRYPMTPDQRLARAWTRARDMRPIGDLQVAVWKAIFTDIPADGKDWRNIEFHARDAESKFADREYQLNQADFPGDLYSPWRDETAKRRMIMNSGGLQGGGPASLPAGGLLMADPWQVRLGGKAPVWKFIADGGPQIRVVDTANPIGGYAGGPPSASTRKTFYQGMMFNAPFVGPPTAGGTSTIYPRQVWGFSK